MFRRTVLAAGAVLALAAGAPTMALAKDAVALNYFRGMPYDQQQHFVKGAAGLDDGGAVQAYVAALHGHIRS